MNGDGVPFLKDSMQIPDWPMADFQSSALNQAAAVGRGLMIEEQEVFNGLSFEFFQMKKRNRSRTAFCIHAITLADPQRGGLRKCF